MTSSIELIVSGCAGVLIEEVWPQLKQRVRDFLAQFAQGSQELLHYVGLAGEGKLATVINTS